jgi:Peptidase inhibitor family I36
MDMDSRITWNRRAVVAGALGIAMLATTGLEAQRWGRPRTPSAGACFYRNADFHGDYFCVPAGEDLDQVPSGLNDRISSIRTFGGAEVTVFRNPGFSGRTARFANDVANLQTEGWNDTLSSLSVRRRGFGGGGGGGGFGGGGFGGGGYGGGGYGGGGVSSRDVDRIIQRAYQDVLDRDPDQVGLREYRRRMIDDGWSEAQVRDSLRRSAEFRERNTMTRQRAEDIVRQAYLSVLGREPDPAARPWVDQVMRNRLTQQDVERELRRSPEYRNRRPQQ